MAKTNPHWDLSNYQNTRYALNISIIEYFKNLLFDDDANRIIYSKSNFAFRKRTNNNPTLNNLDLPFMNFKIDSISQPAENYKWWNHKLDAHGIYVPEIGRKLRLTPINVKYDATFFCHRYDELQYVWDLLVFQQSNQVKLIPEISINGVDVENLAIMDYGLVYNPDYDELEHLDVADIYSIKLDFDFDTYAMQVVSPIGEDGSISYAITEKAILDFYGWYNPDSDECGLYEKIEFMESEFS